MKQMYYMGVDISKEKVDIALIDSNFNVLHEQCIKNTEAVLRSSIKKLLSRLKIEKENLLICCEETGIYKRTLQECCVNNGWNLWVEIALKIKKASSNLRGKSDRQDALRIAEYACRYSDKKVIYKEPSSEQSTLQNLLNAREDLISEKVSLEQRVNETKNYNKAVHAIQKKYFSSVIKVIKRELASLEKAIDELTENCTEISKNVELISSISGIGKQTALNFIVYTNNFTKFESANHLACYAGVAPFPNESGIMIKRARVSQLANKKLKKLLHLAAMSAVRSNGDLKEYYIRKVQEGKNKMLVLNNVRNKLVKRMFAVVKRQSAYVSIKNEINICNLT